jgi:hypothetical protein
LPPIQECCELYSLDAAVDAKTQEEPVEMGLDGSPSHLELAGNLVIVATLQEQLDDLLLSMAQTDGLFAH